METLYEMRGYLTEPYRLFHLRDHQTGIIDWHYHTFHKILFFLAGEGTYDVEGRQFELRSGDVIFVPRGCIHRPEISPREEYERYILYIDPEYLKRLSRPECDLETCFERARKTASFVVRPAERGELLRRLKALEAAPLDEAFGSSLLAEGLFLRLLITLTRATEPHLARPVSPGADPKVLAILRYLTDHLSEPVSADDLAGRFRLSKYHMMRKFKQATGYTIHGYLTSKRLVLARELTESGVTATAACYQSGFQDYSAFSRAYKKQFGAPPGRRGAPKELSD